MAKDVLPPNNIEAEEAVLGSMMTDCTEIMKVTTEIVAADFYLIKHQWIFEAIVKCGDTADLMTVSQELTSMGKLSEVGDEGYLTKIMGAVPYAGNAVSYAKIVKDYSQRRKAIGIGQIAAKGAYDLEKPISATIADMSNALNGMYSEAKQTGATLPAVSDEMLEFINDDSPLHHISTGINKADEILKGGFLRGSYVVLGAAPGTGKTIFAVQMLYSAMMSGLRCIYYSFEVPRSAIICRLISLHLAKTGRPIVPYGAMIDRSMKPEQRSLATDAWFEICDKVRHNVMINDAATLTPSQLTNNAIAFALKGGCDLIVVDQMHHMGDDDKKSDTKQRLSHISGTLRSLPKRIREAANCEMPLVLALARLNRVGYGEPDMSAFKESGDIESDTELAAFLYHDKERATGNPTAATPIFFKVGKNRNGAAGFSLPCLMMGSINRIADAE